MVHDLILGVAGQGRSGSRPQAGDRQHHQRLPTGLTKLDAVLGGLNQGLYIRSVHQGPARPPWPTRIACEAAKTVFPKST
jgi:hypothetical protein